MRTEGGEALVGLALVVLLLTCCAGGQIVIGGTCIANTTHIVHYFNCAIHKVHSTCIEHSNSISYF